MAERNRHQRARPEERERTELYEREMKHDEHRETPLDTAGREADQAERERQQEGGNAAAGSSERGSR